MKGARMEVINHAAVEKNGHEFPFWIFAGKWGIRGIRFIGHDSLTFKEQIDTVAALSQGIPDLRSRSIAIAAALNPQRA
jgi:hypothetical protein